ncbi:ATP-binding protein [Psychroserpens ponticola]|uniref:ATP-binding protein n=1 Tax=Psychroserpens ponticola TaxID=2932268 RepID=A0ABY7RZY4_9FLAO|nr:ATP-binding protein [Psychroserpens ponticola]WCO02598.1 ATP-binding protein [Psychroserpens ponticola]
MEYKIGYILINLAIMPKTSTNVRNRVNKLHLPKTKSLYPLFEVISNSIHAIEEAKKEKLIKDNGKIEINILRIGKEGIFEEISNTDDYPIDSFEIIDNGIGLNEDNYNSFQEFDSEYKIEIGGKGIGRLVCLKAFSALIINSCYLDKDKYWTRSFEFKKTIEGYSNYNEELSNDNRIGTNVLLKSYVSPYKENVPKSITDVSREIIKHFQLYFIQEKQPTIIIKNQDGFHRNLTKIFNSEFKSKILSDSFIIAEEKFNIHISKSFSAQSHKVNYCANERIVRSEGLSKHLVDLKYSILDSLRNEKFYYQVFVVSDLLDTSVNDARTSFNFPDKSENEDSEQIEVIEEVTLSKIRKKTINCIENLLSETLAVIRAEKVERYRPIIDNKFPNYTNLFKYKKEKVERLPVGLNENELDIKLYEIEAQWRKEIKQEGADLLTKKKDITELEDYKELYEKYVTNLNEVGKSDLARYVVHRRSVIDLLEKLIELNDDDKFANEDLVHSLFFPIRETDDSIFSEKQNLWLLDERLTFNKFLASDKLFKQIENLGSDSKERMDLIIKKEEVFDKAVLFSENKIPFESFTIVEFKRPERNDYVYGNPKNDPIAQVRRYIRETIDGETKKRGKKIQASFNTPFYCYVVADITSSLEYILDEESFINTPDGLGYFRIYDTNNYKAYIEVLPFSKVLKDSKERNRVLFERLNLPQ